MLTQSPNDHEALAALRKANKALADYGLNWEQFLDKHYERKVPQQEITVAEMFLFVRARVKNNDFLESIYSQYQRRGSLSQKQFDALRRFYNTAKSRYA